MKIARMLGAFGLLLLFVAATMGAGNSPRVGVGGVIGVGSSVGPQSVPGFAPTQRGSVVVAPARAEDIPGCVMALYAVDENGNPLYASNTAGVVATWTDVSGYGNHLNQSNESFKPTLETYAGVTTVRTGPTTSRYVSRAIFLGMPQASGISSATVMMVFANRMNTGTDRYSFHLGQAYPGTIFTEWGGAYGGGSYDAIDVHFLRNSVEDTRFSATGICAKDPATFTILCYSSGPLEAYQRSIPTSTADLSVTVTQIGYPCQIHVGCNPAGPSSYFHDMNIFSYHVWSRALSQSEIDEAVARIQAAIVRGHR